jgi:hypothetical protein
VLFEYTGVVSKVVNWDIGGSPIPNPCYTIYILLGSSSFEPDVANNDNIVRTQWDKLECYLS